MEHACDLIIEYLWAGIESGKNYKLRNQYNIKALQCESNTVWYAKHRYKFTSETYILWTNKITWHISCYSKVLKQNERIVYDTIVGLCVAVLLVFKPEREHCDTAFGWLQKQTKRKNNQEYPIYIYTLPLFFSYFFFHTRSLSQTYCLTDCKYTFRYYWSWHELWQSSGRLSSRQRNCFSLGKSDLNENWPQRAWDRTGHWPGEMHSPQSCTPCTDCTGSIGHRQYIW